METLFTVSLLELFIGGGGRLLEVGPVTVRMILFAACVCAGLIVAIFHPRKGDGVPLAIGLVGAYLLVQVTGLLIGTLNGHDFENAKLEMRQSLYWLAAPFLAVVLRSRDMILRAAMLVRVAGVVLAVGYIGVVVALALGAIDYLTLYTTLSATEEFIFRSEGFFFYKGFLYLSISTIFFVAMPNRFSAVLATVVIIALAMTLTRGLVLSTSFAALLMLIVQRRWRLLGVALAAVACVAFFLWGYLPSQDDTLAATREVSNSQRIEDLAYIVDNLRVSSLLLGEGFGALSNINGRLQIENTLLWAFWKLGIVGFLFWLMPLILCLNYFARISRRSPHFSLACAYLFSTVLVYVQTMTNPYLNNPIGLSFVLVALFSLRTLSQTTGLPGSPPQLMPQFADNTPLRPPDHASSETAP